LSLFIAAALMFSMLPFDAVASDSEETIFEPVVSST
jgi:hypothetical protein